MYAFANHRVTGTCFEVARTSFEVLQIWDLYRDHFCLQIGDQSTTLINYCSIELQCCLEFRQQALLLWMVQPVYFAILVVGHLVVFECFGDVFELVEYFEKRWIITAVSAEDDVCQ
ncbi:hypothetical protein CFRS1_v009300 [Colletotrichum fructicola]|nr:hypothetical protein CFRS1_v009300 [Colletotrichum fructicola]